MAIFAHSLHSGLYIDDFLSAGLYCSNLKNYRDLRLQDMKTLAYSIINKSTSLFRKFLETQSNG